MASVVVGSGIAGMAEALLLAQLGEEVTLLEAGPRVAPLLRGFRRGGLHFDTGFHYGGGLHQGGVLRRWLEALGVAQDLQFMDGHEDHVHFADGKSFALGAGDSLLQSLEQYFPGHGAAFGPLLESCLSSLAHSPYTNAAQGGEPAMRWSTGLSVTQKLTEAQLPPHMGELLALRCLLYGVPPAQAAWEDYALVAGPYFQSSGSWQGGGAALVAALEKALRKAGVRVLCHNALVGLELGEGKSVRAVLVQDGTRLACTQCFFTGHPRQLAHIVPKGALRPVFVEHMLALPETAEPVMLFAETRALPPGRNIFYLSAPGQTVGERLFSTMEDPEPSLYLACGQPELTEPSEQAQSAHREGDATRIPLLVMAFLGAEEARRAAALPEKQRREHKAALAARLAALTEERCPALRGQWRILESATGHSMRRWIYGSTGSLYGVLHHRENMPLLPVTRVPGLYLAGQNVLLPGVLGGIVSAALAAGFAHGHEAVLRSFRQTSFKEGAA